MNTKSKKNLIAGLLLLVCMLVGMAIAAAIMPTVVYADSSSPYLQVTCGSIDKSGPGWSWDTDESYNGTLTLDGYDGEEIGIGGVDNGKVDIVLVGDNKITVTAPYGNRAIYTYNVSTLTFKGNGSLTIDYQVVASNQVYMHGILMEGESSSKNNGNLTFDESCTVTVKVYGKVAEKDGSVDAIYMNTGNIGSGNVTVGENATLNIDLQCDTDYQTYGIFAKGNVVLNGTVDIKMEYTGSGAANNTWKDVFTYASYPDCSIGTNAKITSVCPGSSGSSLTAFPLDANGAEKISSWTYIGSSEQYFENDDCLVHVWDKCANGVSFKNYSYNKIATPLTFEDKAEYDVPATVYGGDAGYSSIALSASGGSGEYVFSVVSAADGNRNGVGIISTESDFNKIYVNPNLRSVSEATEITVRVKDKGGYSKDVTVRIGEVAAPTYSATVDPVDFGTVRVGYSPVTQVPLRVVNTGTGKINCNLNSITLEGENVSSFTLGYYASPVFIGAGSENTSSWSIKPNNGLAVGTYVATIKFSGTPQYSQYGGSSVEATATVKFVVTEHDFDTTTWEHDENTHWNPCKDAGCAVHGNEAAHDTEGELKNATAATFDTDGYTGDKYCSVCGALAEEGTVIPAGKYIRVSQATMTPAAITDKLTANDLVFASLDPSKYTVALWRVFDLTDDSLNTDGGKYPKDSKFIANHEYAIEIAFTAVGSYEYEEMYATHFSTFTVNGQPTQISTVSSLAGSKYRRITLTAADTTIPVTVTDVQISFSELNVERGGSYTFTATVNGTGAFDNSVIWSVEGADSSTISVGGILSVTANESSSTITVKATSKQDSTKYATKTVTVRSLITVSQKGVETQYKVVAGGKINLTAATAASGYHFKEWQVSGAGTFADKTAQKTEFTVPNENVTITSVYELHTANGEGWLTDSTKHYHVCSCGTEIDAAPHTFGEWTVIKPATEDEKGSRERSCSVCSYKQTEEIDKLPHTHNPASAWTNDATGHWHACSGCNEKLDFAAHTPDRAEATETEPVKCSVCGYVITPALGHTTHTAGEEWLKNADGHWHQCTGCTEKLGVAPHTYGDWTVVTPPTATVDGEQEHICSVCGYKQVESIPATGEPAQVPVTVTGGNGTGNYTEGETVTITANAPEEGKTFKGWRDANGNIVSTDVTYTFTVTGEVSLTAVYEDINAGGGEQPGGGQPGGEQSEKTGLSGGQIAGIVIGSVLLAGIGGFAIFWFAVKKKKFADLIALFKKK